MEDQVQNFDLCRLIFLAKPETDYEYIVKLFHDLIKHKRSPQTVTGLLLTNSEYIIHLLESTEDEIFHLISEVFSSNSELFVTVKCLDVQNLVKTRLFNEWYAKKICVHGSEEPNKTKDLEDTPETIEVLRKTIVANLHKFFEELSNTRNTRGHEEFMKRLDVFAKKKSEGILNKAGVDLLLRSNHSHNLAELVRDYCSAKMPYDFDECTSIPHIIRTISFNISDTK